MILLILVFSITLFFNCFLQVLELHQIMNAIVNCCFNGMNNIKQTFFMLYMNNKQFLLKIK